MADHDDQNAQGGSTSAQETDTLAGGEYSEELGAATQDADAEVTEPDDRFAGGVDDGPGTAAQADERFGDPGPQAAAAAAADDVGAPAVLQPETQGEDPVVAELGEDGEGDLSPEDL
ncbi:hypothetical protein NQ166_02680 [Microbacterium sp. zg.Y1090]|uniref:hypothetical protein n=1 Tax=Microbacterium TaxID=33882 RepID=UPI00214D08E8|nr:MULTISPECIES: hypothetical protein [unclassified Microbacterium]MCR2812466.1 hypothetical protein [Microbacterium sp. zg.Y1084]MCR2817733.1 hypothetical protein [Microbacterium sp. zg.Y1090]MDL5485624.1 hypothetical protein [Microbacterium sp. zg-Y1211]WIM28795.1 hypothetical protein QNO26_02535 [Microbacterium sp. zg-Y1090]